MDSTFDTSYSSPSMPITLEPALIPQILSFHREKKSFTVHNSRKVRIDAMYAAHRFTFPAVHEVGPYSDVDADGEPIPGTHVIEDIYTFFPDWNQEILTRDAERAVVHILGIQIRSDGTAHELTSAYAKGGLSLLPRRAPKDIWHQVAKSGEQRVFLSEVEDARNYIEAVEVRNSKLQQAGMSPMPGGVKYDRARWLIGKFDELHRRDLERQIAPHQAEADMAEADDELEYLAFAKMRVADLVEKAVSQSPEPGSVDKKKLFESLLSDPELQPHLRKHFKIRKRGHVGEGFGSDPTRRAPKPKPATDAATEDESDSE